MQHARLTCLYRRPSQTPLATAKPQRHHVTSSASLRMAIRLRVGVMPACENRHMNQSISVSTVIFRFTATSTVQYPPSQHDKHLEFVLMYFFVQVCVLRLTDAYVRRFWYWSHHCWCSCKPTTARNCFHLPSPVCRAQCTTFLGFISLATLVVDKSMQYFTCQDRGRYKCVSPRSPQQTSVCHATWMSKSEFLR